jgi:uncharacterized cupin superfamily protein
VHLLCGPAERSCEADPGPIPDAGLVPRNRDIDRRNRFPKKVVELAGACRATSLFDSMPCGRAARTGPAYAALMSNLNDPFEVTGDGLRAVRVAEQAGAEHLGASLYELQPAEEMVFHYHVQREELLIVLEGRLSLRTAEDWEELPEGEVVSFPRGECGAHGYRNDTDAPVRVLMVSEMNGPNISIYPDMNQVGIFDAGQRAHRRFGALFNVADAVADYGGKAEIVPPAPGPRARSHRDRQRD